MNKKQYISPASRPVAIASQPVALTVSIDKETEVDAGSSWTRRGDAWSSEHWAGEADE